MNRKSNRNTRKNRKAIARHRLNPSLFIVPKVEGNPRRKGSFGYKSMNVILNARKPMAVATFTEKGGRLRDLHYDINQGHVKLAKKAS
jgi:hypothetical protein